MQIYDNLRLQSKKLTRLLGERRAKGLLFDVVLGLTNLRLNFTSNNTFTVTPEPGDEVLGHITFMLDEDQQPAGYQYQSIAGKKGLIHPSIPDALREEFGDVHMRIESITTAEPT